MHISCFVAGEPGGPGVVFFNSPVIGVGKIYVDNYGRPPFIKATDDCTRYDIKSSGL